MTNSVSARPRLHGNTNLAGNYYRLGDGPVSGGRWIRMTSREREFADHVIEELGAGRIPGPTRLNDLMGTGRVGARNHLGGNLSKIRRALFAGAGLHKRGDGRWAW